VVEREAGEALAVEPNLDRAGEALAVEPNLDRAREALAVEPNFDRAGEALAVETGTMARRAGHVGPVRSPHTRRSPRWRIRPAEFA
jgi:hypothetical protein